jgi:hypothetical protein
MILSRYGPLALQRVLCHYIPEHEVWHVGLINSSKLLQALC